MGFIVFILLIGVCIGFIYIVHKYFDKFEFNLLIIIYSILSFLMSFKTISIFGIDINGSIIFTSGLLSILYYYINRYSEKEYKRFIILNTICNFACIICLLLMAFVVPSINDISLVTYQRLVFDNLPILILYPLSSIITLFLSSYCFNELRKEDNKKLIKTIFTLIGIVFIDTFIYIYFTYTFLFRFDVAMPIAINNYIIKTIIVINYLLIVKRLFMIRKVK